MVDRDYPDIYDLMYSVPNGGKRGMKTAIEMTAEGLKKGYPDFGIDAARGAYHGFRCELKQEKGKRRKEQDDYAEKLRKQGYCVVLCFGYDAAMTAILEYWNLSSNGVMSSEIYKASGSDKAAAKETNESIDKPKHQKRARAKKAST